MSFNFGTYIEYTDASTIYRDLQIFYFCIYHDLHIYKYTYTY